MKRAIWGNQNRFKCNCVNVEFGSYDNQVELPRPSHMPTIRGVNTICVDTCLKDEIMYLWCCCGHNKGDIYPYIGVDEKDIQKMKQLGYVIQPNNIYPEREDGFMPKSIQP